MIQFTKFSFRTVGLFSRPVSVCHHHHRTQILFANSKTTLSDTAIRRGFQSLPSVDTEAEVQTELNDAGFPMDIGDAAKVLENTQGKLDPTQLHQLMSHNATALVVRNFYPRESAIELGKSLAEDVQMGRGRNWKVMSASKGLESSDVVTLGAYPPYNVAQSQGTEEEYFEAVPKEMKIRRRKRRKIEDQSGGESRHKSLALPLWPMDLFRLELDEAWPSGAGIARNPQNPLQTFGSGLPRVMLGPTRWKYGFIHCDEQPPISPEKGIFSANIYLQLPDDNESDKEKGLLEIWPLAIRSKSDWQKVSHGEF